MANGKSVAAKSGGGIQKFKDGILPAFLREDEVDNTEYSHGAVEGFGVISYRGKTWRLKHKGEEHVLTRDGEPITRLDVVLLKANKEYSKVYYASKYQEGDDSPPDCMSSNGIVPDPGVERKQCATCEACPMNVWGSRITDAGEKAKACQDSRRMAVLLTDETLDITAVEPVLLRVPPASLKDLKIYADTMAKVGVPLWKVITRVGFDVEAAYPKLQFKPFGFNEDAIDEWRDLREGDVVQRILGSIERPTAAAGSNGGTVRAPSVNASEEEDDDSGEEEEAPPPPPRKTSKVKAEQTPSAPPKKPTGKKAKAVPVEDADDDTGVVPVTDADTNSLVSKLLGEF